jgi:hypothetical protein
MAKAYSVVFIISDFQDTEDSFYGLYIRSYFVLESKHKDGTYGNPTEIIS